MQCRQAAGRAAARERPTPLYACRRAAAAAATIVLAASSLATAYTLASPQRTVPHLYLTAATEG